MKARKTPESSTFSDVRCSTSSHTTASAGAPRARLDGLLGPVGDLRVDDLERDRAVVVDAELLEVVEQDARVLARDVGEDHVALRPARRAPQVDDVAHGLRGLQHLEGLSRPCSPG